jgi:hypothetical protein
MCLPAPGGLPRWHPWGVCWRPERLEAFIKVETGPASRESMATPRKAFQAHGGLVPTCSFGPAGRGKALKRTCTKTSLQNERKITERTGLENHAPNVIAFRAKTRLIFIPYPMSRFVTTTTSASRTCR